MPSRPATVASITAGTLALVLVIGVIGRDALIPPGDNVLPIPTSDVMVAVRPIKAGTPIAPGMVAMLTVPSDVTNSMAYTGSSEILGKVAAIDILEWQLLTPNLLVEE